MELVDRIEVSRHGRLGVIALDRPEAINALDMGMIGAISRTLAEWREDDAIGLVLFEGKGARGFCSGGDVRAARLAVLEGRLADADAFFAAEYAMNGVIAGYPKPLVSMAHGVTMGGGIGISGHCRLRLAVSGSRFAMPESAIGFVCDVGVNAILARAPLHRALLFLMSGVTIGPEDAMALGLVDGIVGPDRLDALRPGLGAIAAMDDIDAGLRQLVEREAFEGGAAPFIELADHFAGAAWPDAEAMVAGVEAAAAEHGELADIARLIAGRSPTSLEAIFQSHMAARRLPGVSDVLALDRALARHLCREPDFAEGVRAVLVDKDQRPQWAPAGFGARVKAGIAHIVQSVSAPIGVVP